MKIKDNRPTVWRPMRGSGVTGERSQLPRARPVRICRPDFVIARTLRLESDELAISRKVRQCIGRLGGNHGNRWPLCVGCVPQGEQPKLLRARTMDISQTSAAEGNRGVSRNGADALDRPQVLA